MTSKVFAIYDSKVEAYMQPFHMQTKGQALRSFTDLINDGRSNLCKHPEDFTLFELGTFDDSQGKYENLKTPVSCGVAIEYVKEDLPLSRPTAKLSQIQQFEGQQ